MKRAVLALLLLGAAASASAGLLDSALDILLRSLRSFAGGETLKYSLHYELEGERSGSGEGWVSWRFSGPVRVATVGAEDARWRADGLVVGRVVEWEVRLQMEPGLSGLPANTQTALSSTRLRMELDDGSALTELLDDPGTPGPETDAPFQGRVLFELGPVPAAGGTYPARYRTTGCMGVQGEGGALAGKRGALCIGGTLGFPAMPASSADLLGYRRVGAESGFTLVLH